jgi:hypothetical protein
MNKQKLISALQSRIAKRKATLREDWKLFRGNSYPHSKDYLKQRTIKAGYEQRVDKALLKMIQSPFDAGYAVGYVDACKAVKLTLEACECQN